MRTLFSCVWWKKLHIFSTGSENLTCRRFQNLYIVSLCRHLLLMVLAVVNRNVLPLLWKPAWTLKIFVEQLFQFKVLSKMMLQAHAWVQKYFSLVHYIDWNVNKLVWMDSCYSPSFRISFKLHFLGPIVIIMIFERFKMGVKQIFFPCLRLFFSFLTQEAKCKRLNFTYNCMNKNWDRSGKKVINANPLPPSPEIPGPLTPPPTRIFNSFCGDGGMFNVAG